MKIYEDKYLNEDAIYLETDEIRLAILPNLGLKIASIYSKIKDRELLSQPRQGYYKNPSYGDLFSKYDNSGLNDMMPTLEPCLYPGENFKDLELPDRGDLWTGKWDVKIEEDKILANIDLKSLPLRLEKTISLVDRKTIGMDYQVENLSDKDLYYLWSLQGLYQCDNSVEFIFQDDMNFKINVLTHEDLNSFDTSKIKEYRDDRTYKYFFYGKLEKGLIGLDYRDDRLKYLIKYDTEKLPYLGVYVNKRKSRCSLEPSNSFFDSVSVAYDNNTIHTIRSGSLDTWSVDLSLESY